MHNTQDSWESLYSLHPRYQNNFLKCFEIPTCRANIKRVQIQISVNHNTK